MANSFGQIFRITTFGESHGPALGVVIDGCPPGYKISLPEVQDWLARRRPGQSDLSSPRDEKDLVECLSGLSSGVTLGTPLTLVVRNKDVKEDHYKDLSEVYRPSHADYTTELKYGLRPPSGGGRASARETIGRVAAAAVAEQILRARDPDFAVVAWVDAVKDIEAQNCNFQTVTRQLVEKTSMRCPDEQARHAMEKLIKKAKGDGDSVGGKIRCVLRSCPVGLGEPVFDKLEADLAKAMLSLPATKGFEIGSGFAGTALFGSEHNDAFAVDSKGKKGTLTNNSGGIQGGISNGEIIYLRVGFKPVATIFKPQQSMTRSGKQVTMQPSQGRHDPCVLPRAVPIVEAMAVLVIMDHWLRQSAITACRGSETL